MQHLVRRAAALAGAGALTLAAVTGVATPAHADTDQGPARAAAAWMIANLGPDGLLPGWGGSGDLGMTLDLGSELVAVGGFDDDVSAIADLLETDGPAWTVNGTKGSSTAKALAFTSDAGVDAQLGAVDLTAAIEGMVIDTGASTGRIDDAPGGYDSTWTQIWSVKGLVARGSAKATEAVDYLVSQQCADGWFRDALPTDLDADQSCVSDATASAGLDTTALAVLNLAPYVDSTPALAPVVEKAADWLVTQQGADGSYSDPWMGPNANTTGLAAWALDAAGEDAAAARSAIWLRSLQVAGECSAALGAEAGAIAYTPTELADAADGITPEGRGQWIMVGSQAIPGLLAAPSATRTPTVQAPDFAKAGGTVTARVGGLAPGERACLTTPAGAQQLTGTNSDLTPAVPAASAGTLTLTLRTTDGSTSASTVVLGKTTLKVKPAKKKVKKGKRVKVTVKGLAAGERVTVTVKGVKKKVRGTANARGVFTAKVKAPKKKGKTKIKATGLYGNRKGVAKVTVR